MGMCWNGFGWGGMRAVGPILYLVFFVGVLVVLGLGTSWLVRQFRQPTVSRTESAPLEIARRRLAAGEITTTEFEEIRNRLEG